MKLICQALKFNHLEPSELSESNESFLNRAQAWCPKIVFVVCVCVYIYMCIVHAHVWVYGPMGDNKKLVVCVAQEKGSGIRQRN